MTITLTQQEAKLVVWSLNCYVGEYTGVDSDEDIQKAKELAEKINHKLMQA